MSNFKLITNTVNALNSCIYFRLNIISLIKDEQLASSILTNSVYLEQDLEELIRLLENEN